MDLDIIDPSKKGKEAAASYQQRECPFPAGSKANTEWHAAYDGTRNKIAGSAMIFTQLGSMVNFIEGRLPKTTRQMIYELTDLGSEAVILARYGHLVTMTGRPLPIGDINDMIQLIACIQKTLNHSAPQELVDGLEWKDLLMRIHAAGVVKLAVEWRDNVAGMVIPDIQPGQTAPFTVMYDRVVDWFTGKMAADSKSPAFEG